MNQYYDVNQHKIDFNPENLIKYLGGGNVQITRITSGQSNPTYCVEHKGIKMALRKPPSGNKLPSAHAIDREYRVMSALADGEVPVPKMLYFEANSDVLGSPFMMMEWLDGDVVADSDLPTFKPSARTKVYENSAKVLAALHNVDWQSVGLGKFGRSEFFFKRHVERWARQWKLSKTREDKNIEELIIWLGDNIPKEAHTSIVHGDFRIGNLMLAKGSSSIIGVLDWELSTIGCPMSDLAHFCCFWDLTGEQLGGLAGIDIQSLGIPSRQNFIRSYRAFGGVDLPLLPFHRAFALFRLAIIFEGIAARNKTGQASGKEAESVGALSAACASLAINVLSENSI
ncbi:MAG: phosphotransferase family protein [Rhizobiales bacterium]|nr:phosphotransferase family protein [Hyphomicrobiales bacterium]